MELRQLRYLVALADEQHFTRAAARAHVAQPALSRQIAKLEAELGVPLVIRTSRRVSFTHDGRRFADHVRRVLDELAAAEAGLRQAAAVVEGQVVVGVTPTPGGLDVSSLLAAFHERHAGVELLVREALSVELVRGLRADRIDLAFVTSPDLEGRPQVECLRATSEELVAIVARDHPLARRRQISLRRLRDEPFVAFPADATIRRQVDAAAARAGFDPHVLFESVQTARVRELVSRGLGVAVLPAADAGEPGWPVQPLALKDVALRHEVFLAWRSSRPQPPACAAFLDFARRRFALTEHDAAVVAHG